MAIINPTIPKPGTGSQPATDLVSALNTIITEVNGGLDSDNIRDKSLTASPSEVWKEVKIPLSTKIVAGPFTSGYPPEYLFGPQQVGSASVPAPASGVLREVGITLKYSKSERLSGGNATDNGLLFNAWTSGDEFVFGASIPGTDGIRTQHTAGLVPVTPTEVSGYPVNMSAGTASQQMIMPAVGNVFRVVATGPFTGTFFTIHEILIRYRDWGF